MNFIKTTLDHLKDLWYKDKQEAPKKRRSHRYTKEEMEWITNDFSKTQTCSQTNEVCPKSETNKIN